LAKEQAAVNVTNTVAPYTEDFNTFIAEIIATLAGETGDQALINQLKEFIESDDFNSRLFFGLMFGASASVLVSFIGTASGIRFFTNMFMRLPADPASSVVVGGDNLPLVGPDLAQQGMERLAQIGMSPEALQQYQAQLESLRRPAANLNPPPDANIPQPVANVPEGAARDAVNLAADAPESPMEGTLGAVSIIPIAILLTSSLTLLLSIAGSVVEGLFPAPDS
jgi:hypothetical protein